MAIMDLAYWALAPGDAIPLDIIEACARILTFLSLIFLIRVKFRILGFQFHVIVH